MNGKYPLFLAADVSRAVLCAVWDRKEEKRKQPHKVDCVSGVWTKKEPVRVFFCSKGIFFSFLRWKQPSGGENCDMY